MIEYVTSQFSRISILSLTLLDTESNANDSSWSSMPLVTTDRLTMIVGQRLVIGP